MNAKGRGEKGCVTLVRKDLVEQARGLYAGRDLELARAASVQEGSGYETRGGASDPCKTRIQETWEYAARIGARRIGLAYCVGLRREASMVADILAERGLEVVSVICKAGSVPKEEIGLDDAEKIRPGTRETMCNPILQARVLNDAGTDLNVVIGLCVGHDALFLRHAQAPCTVLAVKDRVTGHNPLAALYTSHSYHARLRRP
jgi:uncharacterized metal-binding protein